MEYISVEKIFRKPNKRAAVVSPSGEYIAYIQAKGKKEDIILRNLVTREEVILVSLVGTNIMSLKWAYDNETLLFQRDFNGNENYRLYSLNIVSRLLKALTPYDRIFVKGIYLNPSHKYKIGFMMNKDNPQAHDAYLFDLSTNTITKVFQNTGSILQYYYNCSFEIVAYTIQHHSGDIDLMVKTVLGCDEYKRVYGWGIDNTMLSSLVKVSDDRKHVEILDNYLNNTLSYIRVNTETFEVEVLGYDLQYDIHNVIKNPLTEAVESLCITKYRNSYLVIDNSVAERYQLLNQIVDGEYYIENKTLDNQIWVLKIVNRSGIASCVIFKDHELEFLYHENEDLAEADLSEIEDISYTARDGVEIEGYITYPKGSNRKNLPLVLNVHGGPWSRDIPYYIAKESCWLSNRGFVSLNVNFRGSTGYGRRLAALGKKQWGKTMHTDLLDAVEWAIENGITSRDNVSIFGMSYGGYAVLAGLTLTPEVFCCGVERVGPSNVVRILEDMPPQWGVWRKSFYNNVGDPVEDREALLEISPIFHVNKIVAPLLIAQGKNDPRVRVSESENIVKALRDKNLDYEYLLFDDEGHNFSKDKNVFKFFNKAEEFLNRHHRK